MQARVERSRSAHQHDAARLQLADAGLGETGQRIRLRVQHRGAGGDGRIGSGHSHVSGPPAVGDHQRSGPVRRGVRSRGSAARTGMARNVGDRRNEFTYAVFERLCQHLGAADELDGQRLPLSHDALGVLGETVTLRQHHRCVLPRRGERSGHARVGGAVAVRHNQRVGVRGHRLGGRVEAVVPLSPADRGASEQPDHVGFDRGGQRSGAADQDRLGRPAVLDEVLGTRGQVVLAGVQHHRIGGVGALEGCEGRRDGRVGGAPAVGDHHCADGAALRRCCGRQHGGDERERGDSRRGGAQRSAAPGPLADQPPEVSAGAGAQAPMHPAGRYRICEYRHHFGLYFSPHCGLGMAAWHPAVRRPA